jgi:hypothetical protein
MRHSYALIVPLFATAALLSLAACVPDPNDHPIIARLSSPDGKLVAVQAEDVGGGAAVGTWEEVYVQDGLRSLQFSDRIFHTGCVDDVAVAWEGPRVLRISYRVADQIHTDTSFAGPWWSVSRSPPHGIRVHYLRQVHPGAGYC